MPLATPWPGPLGKESLSPGCSEVDRGAGQALDGSAAPCPAGTGCSQSGARTRGGALLPGTKGVLVLGYPYQLSSRLGPPSTPGALSSGMWGFRMYTDTPALCLSPGPAGEGGLVQMGWTWLCPSGLGGKPAGTACPLGKLKVTHPLPWGPPASHDPAPHCPRCTRGPWPRGRHPQWTGRGGPPARDCAESLLWEGGRGWHQVNYRLAEVQAQRRES